MSKRTTYVALVTDHSSSMGSSNRLAVDMYNEVLETLRKTVGGGEVWVLPVEYDDRVEKGRPGDLVPLKQARRLTNWWTRGTTATYDACGRAIETLEDMDNRAANVSFLCIIITDGGENASRKYGCEMDNAGAPFGSGVGGPRNLNQIVQGKQDSGQWTFVFMATQNGAAHNAQAMGIEKGNTYDGYRTMKEVQDAACQGIREYMTQRSLGRQAVDHFLDEE